MYESDTERWISMETRTAAKEHPCAYCSTPIRPGAQYARLLYVEKDDDSDGSPSVLKFHANGCP